MTKILPFKLALKLRLWRLGSRRRGNIWLQKPPFRFHLGRLGIKLNWSGKARQALLQFKCDREGAEGEMLSDTKRELLLRERPYIIECHSAGIRSELLPLFADDIVLKGELPISPEQDVVYFAGNKL